MVWRPKPLDVVLTDSPPVAAGAADITPSACRSLFMVGCATMAPRRLYNFLIDADLAAALKQVKADTGIPESEQVRRAIRAWLEDRNVIAKSGRQRRPTRTARQR